MCSWTLTPQAGQSTVSRTDRISRIVVPSFARSQAYSTRPQPRTTASSPHSSQTTDRGNMTHTSPAQVLVTKDPIDRSDQCTSRATAAMRYRKESPTKAIAQAPAQNTLLNKGRLEQSPSIRIKPPPPFRAHQHTAAEDRPNERGRCFRNHLSRNWCTEQLNVVNPPRSSRGWHANSVRLRVTVCFKSKLDRVGKRRHEVSKIESVV